jgi:hypothetical protein
VRDLAGERVRLVRLAAARRRGLQVDVGAPVLLLDRIRRDAVFLEAWFAFARHCVELPLMPRADDVGAVEPALAERAAGVVAHVRDRAEAAVLPGERDLGVLHGERAHTGAAQLRHRPEIDPVFARHRQAG